MKTNQFVNQKPVTRGVVASMKAEASQPSNSEINNAIQKLHTAFNEYKQTNDERLNSIEKGDGVADKDTKLAKMDTALNTIQKQLDDIAIQGASAELNAGVQASTPEYLAGFNAMIRTGNDASLVQASVNKTTDSEGGYLAPVEWDRTITKRLEILSPMRSLCAVQTISGNGYKKLYQNGNASSGWVGEKDARPETGTPSFAEMVFETGELYANPSATQQMLDDSVINLESWLADEVEMEFARQESTAFISGDGAKGKPYGLLTFATGGANASKHPFGAIETVASGATGTFTTDALFDLIHSLKKPYRQGAGFTMNNLTQKDARKLKDSDGNYLWQPSLQLGQPATLLGYGINEIEDMPDLAANSLSIGFGDLRRTYQILDRIGIRMMRDPYTNKPYVQFYTTKRVGGCVINPEAFKLIKTGA